MIKNIWGYITGALLGLAGLLFFIFNRQSNKLAAAQAENKLNQIVRKGDKLQNDINKFREKQKVAEKDLTKVMEDIIILDKKKEKIADEEANKTPKDIEDYWNK